MYKHGNIEVEFLGTGTSQGVPVVACNCPVCGSKNIKDKRLRSSVFLKVNDVHIMIDAGPDFRQQMLRSSIKRLDAILITHEHADHIFGLDDIRAFNWVHSKPMDIYAEDRVQKSIKRIFDYVFAKSRYPGIPQMNLHIIDNKIFNIGGVSILPIRGFHHRLPVLGFRIGTFAYLTDMKTIEEDERNKLKGLDILVVNALRKEEHISHFNVAGALELIEQVKPKRSYLTHVSHQMGFYDDIIQLLPENVFLAFDGLKLSI